MPTYNEIYGASYTVDAGGVITAATIPAVVEDAATKEDAIQCVRNNAPQTVGNAVRGGFSIDENEDEHGTWNVSLQYK